MVGRKTDNKFRTPVSCGTFVLNWIIFKPVLFFLPRYIAPPLHRLCSEDRDVYNLRFLSLFPLDFYCAIHFCNANIFILHIIFFVLFCFLFYFFVTPTISLACILYYHSLCFSLRDSVFYIFTQQSPVYRVFRGSAATSRIDR